MLTLTKVTIIELDTKMATDEIVYINVQQITEDINLASLMVKLLKNSKDAENESLFLKTELLRTTNFPRKGIDLYQDFLSENSIILRLDQVRIA